VLLSFALASVVSPAPSPSARAQATVRIVNAARVTKGEWDKAARKREVRMVENGRPVIVRLIEFE